MPVTITKTAYTFAELSDDAKEHARDWYRGLIESDEIADGVIDDATEIAERLGIEFKQRPVKLMSGKTRYDPCVWWSGFSSQGDGACFEGTYSYRKGSAKAVKEYAPCDTVLGEIAAELTAVQRRNFYRGTVTVTHRDRYYHEHSVDMEYEGFRTMDDEKTVKECLQKFMRWIYKQLEANNDYLNSAESVDETIEANEYLFDENGRRIS